MKERLWRTPSVRGRLRLDRALQKFDGRTPCVVVVEAHGEVFGCFLGRVPTVNESRRIDVGLFCGERAFPLGRAARRRLHQLQADAGLPRDRFGCRDGRRRFSFGRGPRRGWSALRPRPSVSLACMVVTRATRSKHVQFPRAAAPVARLFNARCPIPPSPAVLLRPNPNPTDELRLLLLQEEGDASTHTPLGGDGELPFGVFSPPGSARAFRRACSSSTTGSSSGDSFVSFQRKGRLFIWLHGQDVVGLRNFCFRSHIQMRDDTNLILRAAPHPSRSSRPGSAWRTATSPLFLTIFFFRVPRAAFSHRPAPS